jgi:hypothetical protein
MEGQYNRNRRLFITQERADLNTETGRSLYDPCGQESSDSNASWTSSQIKDTFGGGTSTIRSYRAIETADLAKAGMLSISSKKKKAESERFRITDCDVCQQQKMPRYPKSGNSPRAKRNGELIHADIAGLFTPSLSGNDHFLAIIDDFSNVCGIVPMVGGKPALEALKDFVVKVERQLGEKVRFTRTDSGTEFVKGEAEQWYRKKGIIHQLTTPYTPGLNGTIERFMRTTKEMISAMIVDAGLGHGYWDYAARYAAVTIMKISTGKDGISAWKKLTGMQPNLPSIQRFGSLCFVQIPKKTRSKASFETTKAVEGRILDKKIMSVDGLCDWKGAANS